MSKVVTTLTTKLVLNNSEIEITNKDGEYALSLCNKVLMEEVSVLLATEEMQQVRNLLTKGSA